MTPITDEQLAAIKAGLEVRQNDVAADVCRKAEAAINEWGIETHGASGYIPRFRAAAAVYSAFRGVVEAATQRKIGGDA